MKSAKKMFEELGYEQTENDDILWKCGVIK